MKRMIAIALAAALVTVGAPALAHQAAYPGECDDRDRDWHCEESDEVDPVHKRCTGVRNHMWTDGNMAKESIGFAIAQDTTIRAYVHSPSDSQNSGDGVSPDALTPGLIWLETNGFSGLQRSGYSCSSNAHENPGDLQDHSDKVLI